MADQFIYNMTDTWNNGATTFVAVGMNVTDTASAANSKLLDMRVDGTPVFTVDKAGVVVGAKFSGGIVEGLSAPIDPAEGGTGATSLEAAAVTPSVGPIRTVANHMGFLVPQGGIILWSGSVANIPDGWAICDGANGTPDLRNRFVVGAGDDYAVAATGGADNVTLTTAQIPGHTHTVSGTAASAGSHSHGLSQLRSNTNNLLQQGLFDRAAGGGVTGYTTDAAGAHTHSVTGTAASTGGGGSHENRPPYYALAYIMKL